ncbi:uncharacterized protein LOC132254010 [Vitis vinifera]|uniref:uncharacterized protein LOC132254010 n=1 Tax=Vitis vinifera TaxID=29760 RepID=UPI00053F9D54|nr:uncharacterized protein LOC132254010 [Vitis vinifera]
MSIDASLVGFHTSIRPVIAVDGTFLKAKYLGTLFTTTCKDGNNQIYPLAFGIGDSENDASWEWFLQKLHDALGHIDDLFVISNRHGSIEKAVHKVFPHARHGVCTYHVGQNLKTKFKNPAIHKLFHDATYAYHVSEFNFIFGQLEMIDPRAARYLMDIGVDRWARSYSTGKRYNIMTTRIVESLNVVLKNARDLPVLQLVEELRNLLQKWFVTRQQQAMSMSTELTMWADGELHSRYNMSATYLVEPINSKECNVNYAGISGQGKEETQHKGKLELEGKWAEKIVEGFLNEDPAVMARRTALAKRLELYRNAPAEIEEGVLLESLVQSFKRVHAEATNG